MEVQSFSRALVLLSIIIFLSSGSASKEPKDLKTKSLTPRTGRSTIIAFKPFGNKVNVGLDILLPFVKVPTRRKLQEMGEDDALLTVNTAALTIGGLISGLGILLGQLLKSLVAIPQLKTNDDEPLDEEEAEEEEEEEEESGSKEKSHEAVSESKNKLHRMLEPFEFVYRNSTGERVDATLSSLLNTIEGTFLENDIDLAACIQKSLCTLVQRSADNMRSGSATGIEKMIDGITQLHWLQGLIRETAIEEAFLAGRSIIREECSSKYPTCKWNAPDKELYELVSKRVKFE